MAQWMSYLDDEAPVEIHILVENGGYSVKWITGLTDEATGDYHTERQMVGSLQDAVRLAEYICTK